MGGWAGGGIASAGCSIGKRAAMPTAEAAVQQQRQPHLDCESDLLVWHRLAALCVGGRHLDDSAGWHAVVWHQRQQQLVGCIAIPAAATRAAAAVAAAKKEVRWYTLN
jgi:hypothetical protein